MAKESKIVKYINYYLLAAMSDIRFTGKKAHGMTELMEKGKERLPGEIGKNGEIDYAGIDDLHPVIIYHRSYGSVITPDKTDSFGRDGTDVLEVTSMGLFVFSQMKKTEMSSPEIKDFLLSALPYKVDNVSSSNMGMKSVFIKEQGANYNSTEIFAREYKVTKKLNPDFLLMEIKYNIECRYKQSCIKKTPCLTPPLAEMVITEN